MKKKIAKIWLKALRSNLYPQTTGTLRDPDGFCCLGVLCNLHAQAHPKIAATQTSADCYLNEYDLLPKEVMDWAGMKTNDGSYLRGHHSLATDNDTGLTFKQIAKIIEERVDEL